jgi:hypothetical protein
MEGICTWNKKFWEELIGTTIMLLDNIHRLVSQRFGDPYLQIGASSADWTQQSRFLPEDGDRVQSSKRCVLKT